MRWTVWAYSQPAQEMRSNGRNPAAAQLSPGSENARAQPRLDLCGAPPGPFTGPSFLPPFQRNRILVTSWKDQFRPWFGIHAQAAHTGEAAGSHASHAEDAMPLAEDVARWTWQKDRLEQIFGERSAGRFADSWPSGKSLAILLSFDMQADVDAAAALSCGGLRPVPGVRHRPPGSLDHDCK
jgi:hypothetical protein